MKRFAVIWTKEQGTKVERLGVEARLVCLEKESNDSEVLEQEAISGTNLATINVHALVWALDKGYKRIINEEETNEV